MPEGLHTLDSLELHKLNIKIHKFFFSHPLEKMHVLPKNPVPPPLSYRLPNSDLTSYFIHGPALHYSRVTCAGYTYNLIHFSSLIIEREIGATIYGVFYLTKVILIIIIVTYVQYKML